jgi:hypothetical protein
LAFWRQLLGGCSILPGRRQIKLATALYPGYEAIELHGVEAAFFF